MFPHIRGATRRPISSQRSDWDPRLHITKQEEGAAFNMIPTNLCFTLFKPKCDPEREAS